jgi:hypothetical protein
MQHSRLVRWTALLALSGASLAWAPAVLAQPVDTGDGVQELGEPAAWGGFDRVVGTAQWFWVQGKAMPGFELGLGREWFELDLELSFVTLTDRSSDIDGRWAGNQLGAFAMFMPVRERWLDLSVGLGGDFYFLWGVHSDAREAALTPRAVVRLWPTEDLAISLTARSYLVHSTGLELGTERNGSSGPPVLLSTGITWRFF